MNAAGRMRTSTALALALASLLSLTLPRVAPAAPAASADSSATSPVEGRSWLNRLFDRYLRTRPHPMEDLRGRAEATADRYLEFAGRTIDVVLVSQVTVFDEDWHAKGNLSTRLFKSLTTPLQSTTGDGTIRRQLLFSPGEALDPLALADSELLLRSLPFIDDVRIMVIPLVGPESNVAVVVETRDSWPLGVDGKVVAPDRFDAGLYSVNLLGHGLAWSNELVHNAASPHEWGYHGHLRQPNPTGHFIDMDLDFEDSWRRLRRRFQVTKNLVHPGVSLVGGGMLEGTDDRDNEGVPRRFVAADGWLGRAFRIGRVGDRATTARILLVPAMGIVRTHFRARPEVSLTENRGYHDRTLALAGLSLVKVRDFKTNFFYGMGETEDIRAGWSLRMTLGYEDGEFQARSGSWLGVGRVSVLQGGQVLAGSLEGGGYWRNGKFEEGVIDAGGLLASRLYLLGAYSQRWYVRAGYTRGINRFPEDRISLGNREGLRGVDDGVLTGDERLVASLETRIFTPWTLLGFRCMVLGYGDIGFIAAHDGSGGGRHVVDGGG
ncbi:hypothetical protein COW53_06970, partial [bacterium CG17_big_fil_post_rev_8_21_14_2_50_64_8]